MGTTSFDTLHSKNPLILASASPRRRALLKQLGLPFEWVSSGVAEDGASGDPADLCAGLAWLKASRVHREAGPRWVLGADTVVVVEDVILGKPQDAAAARKMLEALSGREHRVVTGFCLLDPSGRTARRQAVSTRVRIKRLSSREIQGYIVTGEPFGKAGSYAIQGVGAFLVESLSGSYSNVVGLPLCEVVNALVEAGALTRFPVMPAEGAQK
jgi:septum formation protein